MRRSARRCRTRPAARTRSHQLTRAAPGRKRPSEEIRALTDSSTAQGSHHRVSPRRRDRQRWPNLRLPLSDRPPSGRRPCSQRPACFSWPQSGYCFPFDASSPQPVPIKCRLAGLGWRDRGILTCRQAAALFVPGSVEADRDLSTSSGQQVGADDAWLLRCPCGERPVSMWRRACLSGGLSVLPTRPKR